MHASGTAVTARRALCVGGLAALLLGGAPGCPSTEATSVIVEVTFDDRVRHPVQLLATVTVDGMALRMDKPVVPPVGKTVKSGDTFLVLLRDDLDGKTVRIAVSTVDDALPPATGVGSIVVRKQAVLPLTIPLGEPAVDGGAHDGAGDAHPDARDDALTADDGGAPLDGAPDDATLDATPDSAIVDLAPSPDLARCAAGSVACSGGSEVHCLADGGTSMVACTWGCANNQCIVPTSCSTPGDISAGGTFSGDSLGYPAVTLGSCSPTPGSDIVTVLQLQAWSAVSLDTIGSGYDTVLFTRQSCADATTEIPLAGPCAGASMAAGTACNDNISKTMKTSALVECGLPPGSYYTWLHARGAGGPYTLHVQSTPSSLADCPGAGNLLGGGAFPVSTATQGNHFTASTSGCGDLGATSPDAVFFFALSARHNVTLSTTGATFPHILYVRSSCAGPDLACGAGGASSGATLSLSKLGSGLYYVVLDGTGGQSGSATLHLTVN